jgi:uncharacterized membrane protein YeiH
MSEAHLKCHIKDSLLDHVHVMSESAVKMEDILHNIYSTATATLINFLCGHSPYSTEFQCFWMAVQGTMHIRNTVDHDRKLHCFHAFILSCIAGYAGGIFNFVWMAKPTSMLSNDLNFAGCIAGFMFVYYFPFGYSICKTLPVSIITVSWAQLFRSLGLIKFCNVCFDAFKDNPSQYYAIPVFGPILYGTMLGNMGGFITKGVEYVLSLFYFCATHFFVSSCRFSCWTPLYLCIYLNLPFNLASLTVAT